MKRSYVVFTGGFRIYENALDEIMLRNDFIALSYEKYDSLQFFTWASASRTLRSRKISYM